jgi:hypothetical protein
LQAYIYIQTDRQTDSRAEREGERERERERERESCENRGRTRQKKPTIEADIGRKRPI